MWEEEHMGTRHCDADMWKWKCEDRSLLQLRKMTRKLAKWKSLFQVNMKSKWTRFTFLIHFLGLIVHKSSDTRECIVLCISVFFCLLIYYNTCTLIISFNSFIVKLLLKCVLILKMAFWEAYKKCQGGTTVLISKLSHVAQTTCTNKIKYNFL